MKKNQYPEKYEYTIKSNSMIFRFDCGDLWKRKNVSKWDDMCKCMDVIEKYLSKHDTKLDQFEWVMHYRCPDYEQVKLLNQKKIKDYEIQKQNGHMLTPIHFNFTNNKKNDVLNLSYEFLSSAEDEFILKIIKKLRGLKKIFFSHDLLWCGFLGDVIDHDFVQKYLKNKDWIELPMHIKESYRDYGTYYNDLDTLIYLREQTNQKIKFEFANLDKAEQKILRYHKII